MARARWARPYEGTAQQDADTVRARSLEDARGLVMREGVTYHGDGRTTRWAVRRAIGGRRDQYEIVANGTVIATAGARRLPRWLRPGGRRARDA